ncbi:MAG: CorA family divalent cation transporter [Hespellia sp.]|nr:CorA family divalent cation transporter [Hespellia sp.]
MFYSLDKRLIPLPEGETIQEGELYVEIMTKQEFAVKYDRLVRDHLLMRSMEKIQHCKADILPDCIIGTILMPRKENLQAKKIGFGFYMDQKKLIFVDDSGEVEQMFSEFEKIQILEKSYVAHAFYEFLDYMLSQDAEFLEQYEESLSAKEDEMAENVNEIPKDFEQYVLGTRKDLMALHSYYKQLVDMGLSLEHCPNGIISAQDCSLFALFVDHVQRLFSDAQMLREYTLQIRDMYQAKIDARQNKVMQFLTIVTTIFMPLTLITGWYGMNFSIMPELHWAYGYGTIILLAAFIIITEIIIFKKKKWL